MDASRKERRRKWWTKRLKSSERRDGGVSKTEGGKPASVDRGRRRVVKQTCISSATSTAGFRQSSQDTTRTMGTAEVSLSSSLPHTHEESDTSHKERTQHDTDITSTVLTNPSETRIPQNTKQTGRKARYIAFIGNLPFTATRDDIIENFQKKGVKLTEVRLLTKKGSGESRGCCFVEFSNAKTLQNALKFHQTVMDGRRLNIEVTCGGGGRSEGRIKRIKDRNEKLRKAKKKKIAK